ncbi:gamma-glutamylcyclotransferase [Hyphomicrobium sp. xq]|jgi:cation transport protein ChaC|uniref:glutathione-specific gamma-glutamylcyclotransferase n=1 Tax=Hyphomicrobium album TaxID=2665159 RepID=A0A6I3KJ56_9HYPH|nr:gamma-glutamylcyclotransferase [Hyphomicrobium album]MTD94449.1 gamma-glutamylcyclotransferase [Hyphomicrobium album]
MADAHDLWIFAYGSLMWRPGFEAEEVVHARLVGWRRSFCIYSRFHRGSDRRPGLVLGLDRGGMCEGIAFRVSASNARQTLRYLREREQVGSVYREALVPVTLLTGERPEVMALAFLVERAHPSYAGDLPLAEQAHVIRGGIGRSGNNIDYLASTLAHLAALGIRERPLERLQAIVGTFAARGPGDRHTRATAASMVRVFGRRPAHARRLKAEDLQRFCYRTVLTARDE